MHLANLSISGYVIRSVCNKFATNVDLASPWLRLCYSYDEFAQLTQWSSDLVEKFLVDKIVQNYCALYRNRSFIAVFT